MRDCRGRWKVEGGRWKGRQDAFRFFLTCSFVFFVFPSTFDLGAPIQWMGRSTSLCWASETVTVSGIVAPPYRTGKVAIYKDPRSLVERSDLTLNQSGVISYSSVVPEGALGVFLAIEATTDRFFGINSDDLESAPSPFVKNFLQIGDPSGSNAPGGYVYHERNHFYLPLKRSSERKLNWEIITGATPRKLRILCLGYIQ